MGDGRSAVAGAGVATPSLREAAQVNREGFEEFSIRWAWADDAPLEPGVTAVVRAKNEAESLSFVLPPLLRAVRHVVVVDNESSDDTTELALTIAENENAADRLEVRSYPFEVARCGSEHLGTPADSVHSLTYFYNWAFSLVRTVYTLKWDGDMVLTDSGVRALQDFEWQAARQRFALRLPRFSLYVVDPATAYLDAAYRNREIWGWPNMRGFEHTKAFEWELLSVPRGAPRGSLPDWSCIELKHLHVDEFANWSADEFQGTRRQFRKRRETAIFQAVATGAELPPGVLRVTSVDDQHVVDYVRTVLVPREKPALRRLRLEVGALRAHTRT